MAGGLLYGWFRQRVGCTLRMVNFELVLSHALSNEDLYDVSILLMAAFIKPMQYTTTLCVRLW